MVFMHVNAETMRHFCKLEYITFCSIIFAMEKHQMLLVCLFHVLQIETNVFLREWNPIVQIPWSGKMRLFYKNVSRRCNWLV